VNFFGTSATIAGAQSLSVLVVRSSFYAKFFAGAIVEAHNFVPNFSPFADGGSPGERDVVLDPVPVGVLPGTFGVVERNHGRRDRGRLRERTHDEQIVIVVVAVHVGKDGGNDFCAESGHGSTVAAREWQRWRLLGVCLRGAAARVVEYDGVLTGFPSQALARPAAPCRVRALKEESMTLTRQLKERADATAATKSADDLATLTHSVTAVEAAGIVENALTVGDLAPDFTLADAAGNAVTLSTLLQAGPVAIAFYRGAWCPYCNLELKALQAVLPEFTAAGATLIAISPQTPDESLSSEEKNNLEFPVLSDTNLTAIKGFGLLHPVDDRTKDYYENAGIDLVRRNGAAGWQLPLPATYVIAPDRRIRFAFVNADYKLRAEPADVLEAVSAI